MTKVEKKNITRLIVSYSGIAVCIVSILTLLDYWNGKVDFMLIFGTVPMAFLTSIVFLVVGMCLTIIGGSNKLWRM